MSNSIYINSSFKDVIYSSSQLSSFSFYGERVPSILLNTLSFLSLKSAKALMVIFSASKNLSFNASLKLLMIHYFLSFFSTVLDCKDLIIPKTFSSSYSSTK